MKRDLSVIAVAVVCLLVASSRMPQRHTWAGLWNGSCRLYLGTWSGSDWWTTPVAYNGIGGSSATIQPTDNVVVKVYYCSNISGSYMQEQLTFDTNATVNNITFGYAAGSYWTPARISATAVITIHIRWRSWASSTLTVNGACSRMTCSERRLRTILAGSAPTINHGAVPSERRRLVHRDDHGQRGHALRGQQRLAGRGDVDRAGFGGAVRRDRIQLRREQPDGGDAVPEHRALGQRRHHWRVRQRVLREHRHRFRLGIAAGGRRQRRAGMSQTDTNYFDRLDGSNTGFGGGLVVANGGFPGRRE